MPTCSNLILAHSTMIWRVVELVLLSTHPASNVLKISHRISIKAGRTWSMMVMVIRSLEVPWTTPPMTSFHGQSIGTTPSRTPSICQVLMLCLPTATSISDWQILCPPHSTDFRMSLHFRLLPYPSSPSLGLLEDLHIFSHMAFSRPVVTVRIRCINPARMEFQRLRHCCPSTSPMILESDESQSVPSYNLRSPSSFAWEQTEKQERENVVNPSPAASGSRQSDNRAHNIMDMFDTVYKCRLCDQSEYSPTQFGQRYGSARFSVFAFRERYAVACNRVYNIREHLKTHLPKKERERFWCECGESYSKKSDRKRHMEEEHEKSRSKRPSRRNTTTGSEGILVPYLPQQTGCVLRPSHITLISSSAGRRGSHY